VWYTGLFGVTLGVPPDYVASNEASRFWVIKPGRPATAKLPIFTTPRDGLNLIDFRLVHPRFRHLEQREHFERIWDNIPAPFHVVCPLRQPLPFFPQACQTTPADLAEQARDNPLLADRLVPCTTAAFFYFADPAWMGLIDMFRLYGRSRVFFAGSSFNDHGEAPPYTFEELLDFVRDKQRFQFHMVVTDELYEACGAFSSHTQVRLPMPHEPPALVMIRKGSVSPEWLAAATGYVVRPLDSMTTASRPAGMTDAALRAGLERLAAVTRA
jgi:hypothetical protein